MTIRARTALRCLPAVALSLGLIVPTSSAAFATINSDSSTRVEASTQVASKWFAVRVKCQKVQSKGGAAVGYIYGSGRSINYQEAVRLAKQNAGDNAGRGYYVRHCKELPWQASPTV